jgi:magnesium chelatase subunit H
VRAYFLTLQYWLAGSDDNVVGMIRALANRYAGHRQRAEPPHEYPEVGVYHPRMIGRMAERMDALPTAKGATGTVGLLMLRSYLLGRDTGHYDGAIAAMEAKGLRVIPAFASGLDSRPAIEAFFLKDGVPTVDAIVSLTGFSLVGGPAYNDAAAAEEMLATLQADSELAESVSSSAVAGLSGEEQALYDELSAEADAAAAAPVKKSALPYTPVVEPTINPPTEAKPPRMPEREPG